MILKSIKIENFRNYKEAFLFFDKNINIFIGNNAQGKTNLLECIYVLAITKSHRVFIDNNLIKIGCNYSRIKGSIKLENNEYLDNVDIFINNKGKKITINNNVVRKISDYISRFNVIIFCPDDLEIAKGSPSDRRRFLNVEIGQLYNKYIVLLNEYNILLKNRNEYLKKITINNYDNNYLNILTNQLVDRAIDIYKMRKNFIEEINNSINDIYINIFKKDGLCLKYETSISLEGIETEGFKEKLLTKYESNLNREILMAQTLIGPHRDDFVFYVDGEEIKNYGSQGQHRIAVLCLKLAEIEIFKKRKKEYPILLLDDIFSELDNRKKNNIFKYLNNDMQIFITTTDLRNINKKVIKDADIFYIDNAEIRKKEEVK